MNSKMSGGRCFFFTAKLWCCSNFSWFLRHRVSICFHSYHSLRKTCCCSDEPTRLLYLGVLKKELRLARVKVDPELTESSSDEDEEIASRKNLFASSESLIDSGPRLLPMYDDIVFSLGLYNNIIFMFWILPTLRY